MSTAIRKTILKAIESKVLTQKDTGGFRSTAELISDIVNNAYGDDKTIAAFCDLSPSTVKRVRLNVQPYAPNTITLEKILMAYGFTLQVK